MRNGQAVLLPRLAIFAVAFVSVTNPCGEPDNGGCAEFCFWANATVTCACADGRAPDTSDPAACRPVEGHRRVSSCADPAAEWECSTNFRCVDRVYLCDGDDDCGDASDESTDPGGACEHHTCRYANKE